MEPTLQEKINKCLDQSAELWNSFMEIHEVFKHKMDNQEMCTDIHNIQNRLMSMAYNNNLSKDGRICPKNINYDLPFNLVAENEIHAVLKTGQIKVDGWTVGYYTEVMGVKTVSILTLMDGLRDVTENAKMFSRYFPVGSII